jgi:hypothetical protein
LTVWQIDSAQVIEKSGLLGESGLQARPLFSGPRVLRPYFDPCSIPILLDCSAGCSQEKRKLLISGNWSRRQAFLLERNRRHEQGRPELLTGSRKLEADRVSLPYSDRTFTALSRRPEAEKIKAFTSPLPVCYND